MIFHHVCLETSTVKHKQINSYCLKNVHKYKSVNIILAEFTARQSRGRPVLVVFII